MLSRRGSDSVLYGLSSYRLLLSVHPKFRITSKTSSRRTCLSGHRNIYGPRVVLHLCSRRELENLI